VILFVLACVAGSDAKDPQKYSASLLSLATAFAAQEGCSCRFVMERDDAFCRDWIRVSPDIARITVDEQAKTVTSRALMGWKRTARFDPVDGCRLDRE
jgi:hypothetical protein